MISGIKNNPHGASFKSWAAKVSQAFQHRDINVTTKHTYDITYKYIWACSSDNCGLEYKRHSKSIDPTKHSCGVCKNKLIQIKPVPRKVEGDRKRSKYQDYLKKESGRVRLENPGKGFGEIMVILAKGFRESQNGVAIVGEIGQKRMSNQREGALEIDSLDDVAGKLNLLNLEA